MVGRKQRELRHAALGIERDRCREAFVGVFGGAHEIGVLDLVWQIDLEPIGRIMLGDIGFEPLRRPDRSSPSRNSFCAMATRWARLTSEKPPVSTGSVS